MGDKQLSPVGEFVGGSSASGAARLPRRTGSSRRKRHRRTASRPPAATAAAAVQAALPVPARPQLPELVQQRLGLLQDWRIEAFGEPAIDRREQVTRFRALALATPQPGKADGGLQLIEFRALPFGNEDGLTVV